MLSAPIERGVGGRALWACLLLLGLAASSLGQSRNAEPASACQCSDGREFSVGSSIFGINSARVVITSFERDLSASPSPTGLSACKDLIVVGQTIALQTLDSHPFLRREIHRRGIIDNICQTSIQFTRPQKSYDFFKDDGTAVTLGDVSSNALPATAVGDTAETSKDDPDKNADGDLTGRDLIQLLGREPLPSDPGSSPFGSEDLKEGAYFILPRQLKALPAADDVNAVQPPIASNVQRPSTIWAGSLGRIQRNAGFKDQALWLVEILPHSAPPSFSRYLHSLPAAFRKHAPAPRKFVLASSDVVEINHFLDKFSLEWTRFGDDSDEARDHEAAGTTLLPSVYGGPRLDLDDQLQSARKANVENQVHAAAMQLALQPTAPALLKGNNPLVLDEQSPLGTASPHLFEKQCFVGTLPASYQAPSSFHVDTADLAIFQPQNSSQVSSDYYAVDLRLRLQSTAGHSLPVVCRFPLAHIEANLLDHAVQILSRAFAITPATR